SDGTRYVAWEKDEAIWFTSAAPDAAWSAPPARLDSGAGQLVREPQLSLAADGRGFAVWTEWASSSRTSHVSVRSANGSWS
ncbi:hypothetical protein QN405_26470, partial [Pseudomonas sp. AH2 (2023)]|nr:hypothetical protein [Pseudomonas sp. AH2 (2023)]